MRPDRCSKRYDLDFNISRQTRAYQPRWIERAVLIRKASHQMEQAAVTVLVGFVMRFGGPADQHWPHPTDHSLNSNEAVLLHSI